MSDVIDVDAVQFVALFGFDVSLYWEADDNWGEVNGNQLKSEEWEWVVFGEDFLDEVDFVVFDL